MRFFMRHGLALVVSAVVSVSGAVTWAEERCPNATSETEARRLAGQAFDSGEQRYAEGDLESALERFTCSNSLVPHEATSFTISNILEELGRHHDAAVAFREHLQRYPDSENRHAVELAIERLEGVEAEPPVTASVEPPIAAPGEPSVAASVEPQVDTATEPSIEAESTEVQSRTTTARIMAWATLGISLASLIPGVVVYGIAGGRHSEFIERRDSEFWTDEQLLEEFDLEQYRAMERAGLALLVVGGVSLVTSLVLFFAFEGRSPARAASQSDHRRSANHLSVRGSSLILRF